MANYEQAVFQYQAAVITAFQQVADALQALDADAKALTAATDTERYAKETLNLVQDQYRFGTASYLQVLYYQTQYQNAKIRSLQAQALRFSDTAALFTALGGGWWNREGPAYQANRSAASKYFGRTCQGGPHNNFGSFVTNFGRTAHFKCQPDR